MAFCIAHQVGKRPSALLVVGAVEVAREAHRSLIEAEVVVAPKHESGVGQHCFFAVVSKMFKYEVDKRIDFVYFVPYAQPVVDTALVVGAPCTHITAKVVLRKSFAQVKAVAINFVFLNPILQSAFHKRLRMRRIVVVVVPRAERVRGRGIEPRTVGCRRACRAILRIHAHLRILPE